MTARSAIPSLGRRAPLLAAIFVAAAVVVLALWRPGSEEGPAAAVEPLVLGIALQPSNALLIIALEKGFFAAEGLAVTVHEFPSGKRMLHEGLLTDAVEAGAVSDLPVAAAVLAGAPLRILATVFNADNVNRVVARRDRGIARPVDLAGKRVATQHASAVHFFLHLFLLQHGVAETGIEPRFLKAEELPAALARGEVDAISMREPFVGQAQALLGGNAITFEAAGLYSQYDLLVVRPELAAERPQVAARLLRALLRAEELARERRAEAVALTARRLGASAGEIEALWPELNLRLALGQELLLLLENEARWLGREGTPRPVPDFLEVIDSAPLEALRPEAVTLIR